MFSKEYFLYLLKAKKYLLLLIVLITLLNVIGNSHADWTLIIQVFITIVLSFALPMDVFYHVHDKKAVDGYFSLPVSRKALLGTGLVFTILIVCFTLVCGVIPFSIHHKLDTTLLLAETLPICTAVILFNSTFYLIGNNLVDGVVMMGAYTFMPLAIVWIVNSFVYSYVAGINSVELFPLRFLSPIYLGVYLLDADGKDLPSLIGLLVIIAVFSYLLYRSYVNRAAERAESQSSAFFSYPFVINYYLLICLFLIASLYNLHYHNIGSFLADHCFLYILLFAIFVAAYFLYRRRFYFSYKMPLYFVAVMAISLLCASLCIRYKAFGLSDHYEKAAGNDYCSIDTLYQEDGDLYQYVKENLEEDPEFIQVTVEVGFYDRKYRTVPMSEQTSDLIERYRKKAIAYYYEGGGYDDSRTTGSMYITDTDENRYYQYQMNEFPDLETLKLFAQDPIVKVVFSTEKGQYQLMADGTFKAIQIYQ